MMLQMTKETCRSFMWNWLNEVPQSFSFLKLIIILFFCGYECIYEYNLKQQMSCLVSHVKGYVYTKTKK